MIANFENECNRFHTVDGVIEWVALYWPPKQNAVMRLVENCAC